MADTQQLYVSRSREYAAELGADCRHQHTRLGAKSSRRRREHKEAVAGCCQRLDDDAASLAHARPIHAAAERRGGSIGDVLGLLSGRKAKCAARQVPSCQAAAKANPGATGRTWVSDTPRVMDDAAAPSAAVNLRTLSAAGLFASHASVPRALCTAPSRHSTTAEALVVVSRAVAFRTTCRCVR